MFSTNQDKAGWKIYWKQKLFLWNNKSAFPEKVKPLCNNKPAFEKVVLFYGILRNVAGVIEKWLLGNLQYQYFSFLKTIGL